MTTKTKTSDLIGDEILRLKVEKKLLITNSKRGMWSPGSVAQVLAHHPEWHAGWWQAQRLAAKIHGQEWLQAQLAFLQAVQAGYGRNYIQVAIIVKKKKFGYKVECQFSSEEDAAANWLEGINILTYMANLAQRYFN